MFHLACLIALAVGATDTLRPAAAVLPTTGPGIDSASLGGIGNALVSEMHRLGRYRVMERAQIDRILAEQGLEQSGACQGGECAVEMGRLLSADFLVLSTVSKVGKTYSLGARLVDVRTGEVARTSARNSDGLDALLIDAAPAAAHDLSGVAWVQRPRARVWPWIAGGAALAGGAVAAVILLDKSNPPTNSTTSTEVQVKVPVP